MAKIPGLLCSRILGVEPQTVFWNEATCDLESNWMVVTMGLLIFSPVKASCPLKGTQVHRPLTSSDDLSVGGAFWAKTPWEYGQNFHVDSGCTLLSGEAPSTVCINPQHFLRHLSDSKFCLNGRNLDFAPFPPFTSTK